MNKIELTANKIKSTDRLPQIVSKALELNLSSNEFKKFKTSPFEQNIEILSFYWNSRNDNSKIIPFIDFSRCLNLTYLYAFTNKIQVVKLKNLVNLKYLDLSYNQITKINLSHNINLQHIDLMGNKLNRLKLINQK